MNVEFLNGWFDQENDQIRNFRWASENCVLQLNCETNKTYVELLIGSPVDNRVYVTYYDNTTDVLNIRTGWRNYTVKFSKILSFSGKKIEFGNSSSETRNLLFMMSDIKFTDVEIRSSKDNVFNIKNLKSNWIDIVYVLKTQKKSNLEIHTNSKVEKFQIFPGGERMLSYKIDNKDIDDNTFEFKIKKPTDVEIDILSVINRNNYFDFLGLNLEMDKSSLNNIDQTKKIIRDSRSIIQWFVSWKCNMSCKYCWQESASDIYRKIGTNSNKTAIEWANVFNNFNPKSLYFTGGEPTLYSPITELINLLNSTIRLSITSNFGKTFVIDKWKNVDSEKFDSVFFSFHPTQWHNPDDFFIKLENFIKFFNPTKIGIEMVLHPDNINLINPDKIREFSIKHNLISPHLDEFVDAGVLNLNLKNENNEMSDFVDSTYSTQYKFKNKTLNVGRQPIFCPAGWKKINIDFEGNVFTCMSAIDRSKLFHSSAMPHYTPIGNIFDPNFRLNNEPILCWESFRCSACDYQVLQHAWTPFKQNFDYQLPIPE